MIKVINLLPNNRNEYCLLIKGAFDDDFCEKIISEKKESFKQAKTHYPTSYRNNERQVVENQKLSNQLFEKIKNYIPKEIKIEGISKQECGKWTLDSLNSRIRICRYLPNQYFNKHLDGVHFVSENKQSKLTFMIYLNGNEDFDGGRTLFFNSKEEDTIIGSYEPKKGDLIIFDHNLWHSGETVFKGEKYILRSDIVYKKVKEIKKINHEFCGEGHLGYIWTATVCNDKLITSGRDKKIKIWTKQGKKISELIGHKNSILSLISFDNNTLISASRDMSIKIWRNDKEDSFQLKRSLNYHQGAVLSLCKINKKEFFSGGADGILNRIDNTGQRLECIQAHHEWIWGIANIDNVTFATISEDGSIKIWKLKQNQRIAEVTTWKADVPINSIATKDNVIYLGRLNGTIVKLQFKHDKLSIIDIKKCHQGIIRKLVINHDFLYSASEDNTLKIWRCNTLKYVQHFEHRNFVQDIALFDNAIITVSYDGEIQKNELPY